MIVVIGAKHSQLHVIIAVFEMVYPNDRGIIEFWAMFK
jgi:hypothetical protein